jgi:hypothetical protein
MIAEGGIGRRYSTRIVGDLAGNILLMRGHFRAGQGSWLQMLEAPMKPASPCVAGETPEPLPLVIATKHGGEALSI